MRRIVKPLPIIRKLLIESDDEASIERFSLTKARMIANNEVLNYLQRCKIVFSKNQEFVESIKTVEKMYHHFLEQNLSVSYTHLDVYKRQP